MSLASRNRWAALTGGLLLLATGCGPSFSQSAARYGHAEETATTQVLPLATAAYTVCRKEAEYRYLGQLLGIHEAEPVTGEPWAIWYGQAKAMPGPDGTIVTWETHCVDWQRAGDVVAQFLRALRAHARALAAVAEGKDFDASGIATAGDAIATAGGKLVSGTYMTTVKKASGGVAGVTDKVVELARDKKLKDTIANSDVCVQAALSHLGDIRKDFAAALDLARSDHGEVLKRLRKVRHDPAYASVVALGDAIELAGNDDMELERLSTLLTKYGDALDQLGKAHHALALFADGNAKEKDVAKLLGDLEATEETLLELEGQ